MYPLWNRDKIVYKFGESTLRIGTDDDDVKEITEDVEVWNNIIKLFDGKNSVNDIILKLVNDYNMEEDDVIEYINIFKMQNMIDIYPIPYDENNKFNSYFQSVITYYSSMGMGGYKFLEKLQNMKVTVLGGGAGGSHIAYYLAQNGVGRIHIVDPDIVNETNLNRQALFELVDVGRSKAECLKEHIDNKNNYVKITTSLRYMKTCNDILSEIKGSDWVICAMDEPPYIAQRITNKACYELDIPSIYCFSQKSAGKMFMVNGRQSACADCLLTKHDSEEFRNLIECFNKNFNNVITANSKSNITILCSWIVNKWINHVSGISTESFNKLYRLDFNTLKEDIFDCFEKNVSCPTCSSNKNNLSPLWKLLSIN